MVDFQLVEKIRQRLGEEEREAEKLIEEAWRHFSQILNGYHKKEKVWGSMQQQKTVIEGHINRAKECMAKGDFESAMICLEFAEKSNSVIEEFESLLEALEREELKEMERSRRSSMLLKNKIDELKEGIKEMRKLKRAA